MKRLLVLVCLLEAALWGQSGISAPTVGIIRDGNGLFRHVLGLAGNFVVSGPLGENVESAALSGGGLLVKTEDRLRVLSAGGEMRCELRAPAGPARFAASGTSEVALVYYPQTEEFVLLRGCRASPVPLNPIDVSGEVISLLLRTPGSAQLLVNRNSQLWLLLVSLPRGVVIRESPLAGASGPSLLRSGGVLLFGDGMELVVREQNQTERRIPLAGAVSHLAEAGNGWVHIVAGGLEGSPRSQFLLRSAGESNELFRLPEVAP